MTQPLNAALIDVGGTLWPNSWPLRENDGSGRRSRVAASLPAVATDTVERLVADLIEKSRFGDNARSTAAQVDDIGADADTLVTSCLTRHRLPADPQTVARVRRAMAVPVVDRLRPLPGAIELLAQIRALGLRTVVASNTYWRDAESYWEDFRLLGMAEHIDGIVTSVDAGHLKPHPAVFELAMRAAGTPPERCVVIGNSEVNDVGPAIALGMHAILVHPDDPAPTSSLADAIAPDLWSCAEALKLMLGRQ